MIASTLVAQSLRQAVTIGDGMLRLNDRSLVSTATRKYTQYIKMSRLKSLSSLSCPQYFELGSMACINFNHRNSRPLLGEARRWLTANGQDAAKEESEPGSTSATPPAEQPFGTSPFASSNVSSREQRKSKGKASRTFIPPKAAVNLTEKARLFFKGLLESRTESGKSDSDNKTAGIMLRYQQASDGQPRMVFTFGFISLEDIQTDMGDEGVSLEVVDYDNNGAMALKSPLDAFEDGLPKLYIHHGAFLKVLGATLDISESGDITLFDREGNRLDPNV
jgi:hypothetical protein